MTSKSSTEVVPEVSAVPRHIAIIMDGNGRWATKRFMPRVAGHVKGVEAVRGVVEACAARGVEYVTFFAFSSENWRRPADEVSTLMRLFVTALEREVSKMHANGIRLKIVGDLSRFDEKLQKLIAEAERKTEHNSRLTVTVCANYGGRWDIMQAINRMVADNPGGTDFSEAQLAPYLSLAYAPEPDLFIRTGGEERISNFLLWQLAYSELYFTDTYWPDFDQEALSLAISSYQQRERRFGRTSQQVVEQMAVAKC
ncbi:MAG: polyprenyl diphosphate synthase [Oxalicibacterium faecigallinarum]|uniref:Isoprenyl transferase n=1 Tax=Oxalicibacterium faecigallinarum TaxID=573741 RepID=A0A8J3AMZ2_9BURK|nr:polyprenyl diphosphate synthase [Oxalicibacterium faecigallinarum]MDQ7969504.1 polyprenyl diphosphate synthase [Oxalicibacterium faecigallinarum]GGI16589.1 isoprenyl transferase [Oxalicibacterium faecigallinarum]